MTTPPRIIVVGAGIIGASIAWHLTAVGARVTIVDVGAGGGIATPNSFAWINASWGNPEPYFRLRIRAMTEWECVATAVPGIPLAWTGGLCWDLPPPQLESYASEYAGWGYGIRRVDRAEAIRLEPNLREPPDLALHVAEEGAVEPRAAAEALLADAERRGATIRLRTPVNRMVRKNDSIVGIETAGGRLEADEVVLAAGAATAVIAMTASIAFPLLAPPGLLANSHPHARLLNGLVLAPELHMRQTAEGRVVIGADFGGADPGADADAATRALFAKAKAMLRGSDFLALDFHSVGYRPTPADGFPVIGRAQGLSGLYLAVMHSGITLAPAVGLFAADEIVNGRRDPLLAPYAPSRFAGARFPR